MREMSVAERRCTAVEAVISEGQTLRLGGRSQGQHIPASCGCQRHGPGPACLNTFLKPRRNKPAWRGCSLDLELSRVTIHIPLRDSPASPTLQGPADEWLTLNCMGGTLP